MKARATPAGTEVCRWGAAQQALRAGGVLNFVPDTPESDLVDEATMRGWDSRHGIDAGTAQSGIACVHLIWGHRWQGLQHCCVDGCGASSSTIGMPVSNR